MEKTIKTFRIIAKAIMIYGICGFIFAAVATATRDAAIWQEVELPLGDPESIAVDRDGRIYCALGGYKRVQVYGADGHFVTSWPYPGHQPVRLKCNNLDQLEMADPRRLRRGDEPDIMFTFEKNGKLIGREVIDGIYDMFGPDADTSARSQSGRYFQLRNRWLLPSIIEISEGSSKMVVKQSWLLRLFGGPLPAWFIIVAGSILLGLSKFLTSMLNKTLPSPTQTNIDS